MQTLYFKGECVSNEWSIKGFYEVRYDPDRFPTSPDFYAPEDKIKLKQVVNDMQCNVDIYFVPQAMNDYGWFDKPFLPDVLFTEHSTARVFFYDWAYAIMKLHNKNITEKD